MYPVTKEAYANYEAQVKDFFDTQKVKHITTDGGEPFVSSHGCDACGDSQQQLVYDAIAIDQDNNITEFQVCEDCAYYIEYGRLNDTIMDILDH